MTITKENIVKVLDRAVTVYNVWRITEDDNTYSEYCGIEETLALVLCIEQTEAEQMIKTHRIEKEWQYDFFEF
jgi:hypothetical protein